jgi:hypothetical protein
MTKELKYGVRTTIPARIGVMSLVGIMRKEYPLEFGNYFSFAADRETTLNGRDIRCLNFWAENLAEAARRFLPDGQVQVIIYTIDNRYRWAIIDEDRIPKDWYNNKLCLTGCAAPPVEFAKEMHEYLGDPTNELEQYTDPKSYWAKRGWRYLGNGVIAIATPANADRE